MRAWGFLICFAAAGCSVSGAERAVTVCLDSVGNTVQARAVASRIFAEISVRLHWKSGTKGCPEDALRVTMSMNTPVDFKRGALAYAKPYEGASIVIFYDRIVSPAHYERRLSARLLGHVLAHEIGHMLEGIARHSESGVMKARWVRDDFEAMTVRTLSFESVDRELIHEGLEGRRSARSWTAAAVR